MHVLLLLCIVSASAVISVGTTTVTFIILRNDLTTQAENANTIVAGSILGIGIIGLVLSQQYPQTKTSKKIKTILIKARMLQADVDSEDDIKRNYYLESIIRKISLVIKDLVILENSIRKYHDNSLPMNWHIIRYIADRSRKQIAKVEQEVILDFAQILDLVNDRGLIDRNRTNNLHYSLYLCQEILRINPDHHEHLLRRLTNAFRAEIAQLDEIVALLEKEREKTNSSQASHSL